MRESEVGQSCPTLGDPMDCSLLGFSVHGIFQARVLEWDAIAFSGQFLLVRFKDLVLVKAGFSSLQLKKKSGCHSDGFNSEVYIPHRNL